MLEATTILTQGATEGAEHTEGMIKDMFYLLCLLWVARSASVYSVVRMFCRRRFMPRRFGLKFTGNEQRATAKAARSGLSLDDVAAD